MESWWAFALAALLTTSILIVPGLLACCAARVRPLTAALASVPVTMTIIALSAHGAATVGLKWGLIPVAAGTLVTCLLVLPLRFLNRNRPIMPWRASSVFSWKTLACASAVGAIIHSLRLAAAWKTPIAISQTYDAPFHLNLIGAMVRSGDASFLHVDLTAIESPHGFYPAVFHEICALVVGMANLPVPLVVNALTVSLTAIVWPVTMGLATACMTRSWMIGTAASLLSFCLSQMPVQLIWYGVLYPNLLGYCLIPSLLALVWLALWRGDGRRTDAWVLGLFALPGLAVAHTSALFTFAVLAFPFVIIGIPRASITALHGRKKPLQIGAGLISIALTIGLYLAVNELSMRFPTIRTLRTAGVGWNAMGGPLGGLARALSLTAGNESYRDSNGLPFVLGILVLIGMVVALRRLITVPLVLAHALSITVYVLAWTMQYPQRPYFVGMWYSDIVRISSIIGITAVPLLAIGTLTVASALVKVIGSWRKLEPRGAVVTTIIVTGIAALMGQFSSMVTRAYDEIGYVYAFDTDHPESEGLLSRDEYRLLERIEQEVPAKDVIIGNPWNGSVFAPAIADRKFVFPHVAKSADYDGLFVAQNLGDPQQREAVCSIIEKRRIHYVLDFGDDYLWHGDVYDKSEQFPAVTDMYDKSVAEVIDQEGDAKLLKITECDQP